MIYLKKIGNSYNVPIDYYECDTESDKDNYDTTNLKMGDQIYVIETQKTYTLNSSKEWKIS